MVKAPRYCANARALEPATAFCMLNEFSFETRFILCSLVVWRLTHLVVAEDGPWNVIVRLRSALADSVAGRVMDCFYCSSMWLAIPFAFVLGRDVGSWILFWLGVSGMASLFEQATNHHLSTPPGSAVKGKLPE